MPSSRAPLATVLFALATALAGTPAEAGPNQAAPKKKIATKLYKWVDDKGVTHFGNAIPPEYASQGGEQLDKQGNVVKTIEAEKTGEALAEAERQRAAAEEARRAAAEQAKHDKMLLGTYPTLADLKRARDAKVQAIEAQARLASSTIANLERETVKLERQAENLRKANKPLPDKLTVDIQRHREDLLTNQRFVLEKQSEAAAANTQYEKDRARLIQLRGNR